MLIFHSRPSDPQTLFDNFLDQMRPHRAGVDCDDVIRSKESRRGEVMQNIEYYFNCMDTSCSAMGLRGLPNNYSFEHQAQQLSEASMMDGFYGNEERQRKTLQQVAVQGVHRLNSDQRKAFNCVTDAISGRGEERYFFIEGAGGKTFLYNTLIRWCLAGKPTLEDVHSRQGRNTVLQSGSVISAASTGIAALLLLGGGTVHRQFSVPNDINDNTPPQVAFESARARQLRAVDLIIIDEISMLSNKVLRYIDRVLRDVCAENKPFGGKVIVLGGDWKQLTPVVEHGTREDQVQESIKIDPLFVDNFKQLSLTVNMRTAPAQEALRQWLLQIGNGFHQAASGDQQGHKAKQLPIPKELVSANLTEIIDFCFPAAMFEDPKSHGKIIKNNAILCPTNIDVQVINDAAMEKVAGAAEGAPVMLIRNLDITSGLCNGTRMQIDHMTDANLYCRLLTGPREGQEYIIPRVKFEYGQGRYHRGLRFRRIQFPAQGQTLQKMGLVLSGRQCFSHGQVYVAMSRVTTLEGIRVFSPYTSRGEDMFINNVVFHELLNDASIPPRHLLEAIDKPNAVTDLAEDSDIDFQELDLPCGDWKQLTPVVEHGTREDQVQESIKIDPLFVDNFKQLSLTVNMRTAPAQEALRQWLLQIGNGFHQAASGDQQGHKAKQLPIPKELNNAILCPTNIDVQVINDAAMEKVAGAAVTYLSIDEPLEPQEEFGTFRSDFNLEAINNETPSGMPPHKLILKEGAPVMLIRNLDITSGLCNGTRMQIDHMTDANLYCRLLTGPREGQEYIIPRVKFEYGQGRYHRGLRFRRIQFPVRPCFAMTVNKAQGQTLQKMGLVLSGRQCFSHGQVYVAMSRVTTLERIRVFSPYTSRGEDMFINNVVFHELLNDAAIPPRHLLGAIDKPNAVADLAEDSDIDFQELDLPC
uniref:ATP-dependent DNA helicase n=1 Tax=Globodera pallida TaxID=36090 RepID=A0A183CL30_GLOPA